MSKKDKMIIPTPMAQITINISSLNCTSNQIAKLMKRSSAKMSHNPLLRRKFFMLVEVPDCCTERYTDTPDRNTNVGAHKCVIHLAKNTPVVVVDRSVGLWVIDEMCNRSLV